MKRLALLAALLLPLSMAFAQQNVGFKTDKVEPLVINPDNSVTSVSYTHLTLPTI